MTHELGPDSRALLDAAREGLSPDAAAIARVRSKVGLAVGAGAAGTAAGLTLAGKLGILAVVAAIATGGYLEATRDPDPAPRATVATSPAVERPAAPTRAVEPPARAREAPAPSLAPAKPVVKPRAKSTTDVARAPARIEPKPIKLPNIDLAREVELVDRAMASLRRGDPRDALAAVRTHATETHGSGQLAEDAAAIEIEALCKLSDASVTPKLASFESRWPHSAQRSRLTTSCP
ncbi:MAG: hypothetical protein WKG01_15690 [Kofleriaceae bacterium]